MLKHIVFWKIKDNEDKEKNMERMVKMLYSLDGKIKGLESIELGYNLDSTSEYDVVLCAILKSPGALKFYQNHPDHVKCKNFISTISEKRVAFDFVPEDPEFLDISPDILDFDVDKEAEAKPAEQKPVEQKPAEAKSAEQKPVEAKPVEQKPAKKTKVTNASTSDDKKIQIDVSDIQTSSANNYQSLVRPIIPGINAPIDFVPTEEPEPDYSIIPEFIQKTIKETQEDYDVLESIIDEEDPYGFEIANESAEDSKPAEAAKPIEPIKPVEAAKPIEPIKPVEAAKPIEPIKPVEAAKPIEPIKPVEAVKPIEPIKPVEAAKPIEPIKPVEAAKPIEPIKPVEAVKPIEPIKPVEAVKPIEPIKPVKAVKPIEPIKPVEAVKPIEPIKPVEAVKPIEPIKPVEAAKPIEPIKPVEAVKPIEPIKPVEAVKPIEPIKPVEAAKPIEPIKPVSMPFASKPKAAEADIPPIPVKHRKSRLFGGKKEEDNNTPKEVDMSNKWTCTSCGRINANYVGTCGCGASKPLDDFGFISDDKADTKSQEETLSSSWRCPDCGALHANFITDCKCGYVKPDGFAVKPMTGGLDSDTSSALPPFAPMRASDVISKPQKEIGTNMPKPAPIEISTVDKEKVQDLRFGERKANPVQPAVREPKKPTPPPAPISSAKPTPPPQKPEKKSFFGRKKKEEEPKQEIDMSKFWKCPTCGKYNHNYVGTCGCGDIKPFEFNFGETKEEDAVVPKSNAWKCPTCGKLNNNFVSICQCGYNNSNDIE